MKFISRYLNHVMVMEPAQPGKTAGRRIQFVNGTYDTEDKAEIKFIKGSRYYGIDVVAVEPERKE